MKKFIKKWLCKAGLIEKKWHLDGIKADSFCFTKKFSCKNCGEEWLSREATLEKDKNKQLDAKDALIKNLLEVVEFYGDRRSWTTRNSGELPCKMNNDQEVSKSGLYHGGKKARETLKQVKELGNE